MREDSIDIAKGLGIAFVVIGHIVDGPFKNAIFLWHMPLFIWLSGYLFKPGRSWREVAVSRAQSLLIPYCAFLVVLAIPQLLLAWKRGGLAEVGSLASDLAYGGRMMAGWFGVFWFVTCLYVTQITAAFAIARLPRSGLVLLGGACLTGAYVLAAVAPGLATPGNVAVALFALPIFLVGYGMARVPIAISTSTLVAASVCFIAAAGIGVLPALDMKQQVYGAPVVTLIASLVVCCGVLAIAPMFAGTWLRQPLVLLGSASLVIMFTHQAVQLSMQRALHIESPVARVAASLAVGSVLFALFNRHAFSRRMFLGKPSRTVKLKPGLA